MSRNTPMPVVNISSSASTDRKSGTNAVNIIIDVNVGGYSSGFVVLDEPGDLFILREAIDRYIDKHNLKQPQSDIDNGNKH